MSWMTGNNRGILESFNKIESWEQLHRWHQINTPWFDENQINLLMKSYHNEAK